MGASMSRFTSSMQRSWSSVSWYGKAASNSLCQSVSGGKAKPCAALRREYRSSSDPARSSTAAFARSLRRCHPLPPEGVELRPPALLPDVALHQVDLLDRAGRASRPPRTRAGCSRARCPPPRCARCRGTRRCRGSRARRSPRARAPRSSRWPRCGALATDRGMRRFLPKISPSWMAMSFASGRVKPAEMLGGQDGDVEVLQDVPQALGLHVVDREDVDLVPAEAMALSISSRRKVKLPKNERASSQGMATCVRRCAGRAAAS